MLLFSVAVSKILFLCHGVLSLSEDIEAFRDAVARDLQQLLVIFRGYN